jgi:hypothetical protein
MNNLYGVQNYSNNPLNMQRRDEHFVIRRAFFALFLEIFFSKFCISRYFYDLLGKYWWCYSMQKNAPVHF